MTSDWDDLRLLLALHRGGTVAAAALRLRIDPTTVSRRLARAEARAGARLFERIDGRLRPTQAGETLIAAAERLETDVDLAFQALGAGDTEIAGLVRVTAVPILANRMLVPALPQLLRAHPALQIDLIAEPRDLSLMGREADIALRLARPARELRAKAWRIGDLAYAAYARHDTDRETLPWIGYTDAMRALPQSHWLERASAGTRPPVLVNDAETLLRCLKAGLGKSLLPVPVGDACPDLQRLAPPPGPPPPMRALWLMTHPDLLRLPRIRAVTEWLAATFRGQPT